MRLYSPSRYYRLFLFKGMPQTQGWIQGYEPNNLPGDELPFRYLLALPMRVDVAEGELPHTNEARHSAPAYSGQGMLRAPVSGKI